MKTYPTLPMFLARRISEEPPAEPAARGAIFAPLSAPAIFENRIVVTSAAVPPRPRYPYKRADEAVN